MVATILFFALSLAALVAVDRMVSDPRYRARARRLRELGAVSNEIRGSEVTISISVDGALQPGSFASPMNWKMTPGIDIKDVALLGELRRKHNLQVNDYAVSFGLLQQDKLTHDLLMKIVANYDAGIAPPAISITVRERYFDGTSHAYVLEEVTLKPDDQDVSSREDFVKWTFSGKATHMTVL